jgi:integrase
MSLLDVPLPYLSQETDRHGNPRLYVRRHGRRVRIQEPPGSPEFVKAYTAAVDQLGGSALPSPVKARQPFPRGTLGWLGAQYFASDEFQRLNAESQSNRRGILEACFQEPHKDDDPEPMGFCPLANLSAHKVKRLRDLKKGLPGAANNRRKYLSAMFGWAIESSPPLMKTNPARDVRRIKYASEGFHTWTADEVRRFEERHPVGTKARLALALLLFTGTRRGDMVTLGRQHVKDGWLRFIPRKTRYKRQRLSEKPLLPELARIIAASPTGDLTFLVTAYGKPFTAAGFGGWFRDRCNEAGLLSCSAHGLRKAGATLAAENGATVNQLMAIFDWETPAQAKIYTDAADRKRMAGEAMGLLAIDRTENEDCRTEKSGGVAPK